MNSTSLDNLLAGLFPQEVVTDAGLLSLTRGSIYPEEQVSVQHAVDGRKLEFAVGRICARRALARLGIHGFPLVADRNRAPVWPPGIVGSISHCEDYCAVAVARWKELAGIGLDMERVDRLREELWQHICTPQELAWVNSLPCEQRRPAVAVVFSAKESFYKCQYPITGQWLEFMDAVVHIDDRRREYDVEPAVSPSFAFTGKLRGRFIFHGGLVLTGMTLTQEGEAIRS